MLKHLQNLLKKCLMFLVKLTYRTKISSKCDKLDLWQFPLLCYPILMIIIYCIFKNKKKNSF